jgi:hypothetical protein
LPPTQVTTSTTTFTTTRKGRLLIDFTGSGQLNCSSASFVQWWLQLDGVPVRSSSLQLGRATSISFDYNGFPAVHLTGITDSVRLAAGCASGTSSGSASSFLAGVGSVTVLARGLAPSNTARHVARESARKACVTTDSDRRCR